MWNFLGGAVGALGSIYGAQQNAAAQNQSNVFNYDLGVANMAQQKQINDENLAQQQQFAQQSAGWRVSDLVKAAHANGLNPLSVLGVQGSSFSNLVAPQNTSQWQPGSPGAGFSQAGQGLGRAIAAIQSPEDRAASALSLEHASLQNDLLRSQIAQLRAPGLAAGVPEPRGGASGVPDTVPGDPGTEWARSPDAKLVDTPGGGVAVIPPKEISQLGFFHPASLSWYARNGLLPAFGDNVPAGQQGKDYNFATMTYGPTWAGQAWETAKRYYKGYNDFMGRMPPYQGSAWEYFSGR